MKTRKLNGLTRKILSSAIFAGCLALGVQGAAVGEEVPTLGENSSYTLVQVEVQGENTITKYEYDAATGAITPVYYRVDLKQTVYGHPDAVGAEVFSPATVIGTEIKYYTDPSRVSNTRITTNLKGVDLDKDFFGNSSRYGGAISNDHSTIGNITGDFIGNNATKYGGAIYNEYSSAIGNITGDFIANNATSYGGAIYNDYSTIGDITGDFIGNSAKYGGAIHNDLSSTISNISGNFIGNNATNYGGAIYNDGTIGNITGDFIGNSATYGGVIYNLNKIGDITGDFIANNARYGGAIDNSGTIGDITSDFIGNSATYGGAIHNVSNSTIGDINGDFTGNSAVYGGAVYNASNSTIDAINGDFVCNSATYGGAIHNDSNSAISDITGNFIGNSAGIYGGAIYNGDTGTIGSKDGNGNVIGGLVNSSFLNNYAKSEYDVLGGAIYTTTDLNIIAKDGYTSIFRGNYTESNGVKEQNAIYVDSSSAGITLNAVNNGQIIFDDTINGVSGYNLALTGDTSGKITLNNLVENANATLSETTLKLGNTSDVFKTSNLNAVSGVIDTTDGNYTNYNINKLNSSADVKYNIDLSLSAEEQLSDTFTVGAGSTGTIYLSSLNVNNTCSDNEKYILQIIKAQDNSIQLDYDNSKVLQWAEAKMTSDIILAKDFGLYTTDTTNDSLVIRGLLDSLAEWAELDTNEDKIFTFVDSSNKTLTRDITELNGENITIQGAGNTINIDNHKFLDLISGGQNVSISDVTIENSNDITNNGTLTLESVTLADTNVENNNELNISGISSITGDITNNAQLNISDAEITFNNEIDGKGNINVSGSTVNLNNSVSNQTFAVENSDITLNNVDTFTNNSLYMNSGSFNVSDLGLSNLAFDTLSLAGGNINIGSIDVDLANETMGRITANTYKDIAGTVNVNNLNLISSTDKLSTDILFADKELAGSVSYNGEKQIAYSPVYKYDVTYSAKDNGGYFNFARSGIGTSTGAYNPSVFAAPVATQVGGYLTQSETLLQSFYHMNRYTKYTRMQRLAAENNNRYAITEGGVYSPLSETSKGIWYNPYTSFETVNLKGGIGVSNVTYGTLVGGDTDLYDLGHGYKGILSTFIGYNGSHQSYNGNSIYQNGGTLGVTGTLYKNNFFTGITASAGASTGSASTMYGTDNFTMLTAGIASKTGYNWEIKEGKFIVQPTLYLAYTFVNTFDYTNAAGVRIDSDPLHALQVMPGVTFIGNLKNGWQPYASVNMVWNAMDKTHFTANDARLPQLSVKPYVQYGVGVQKTWGERFTGFVQAMLRNGGRNGIALSAGFRWALGNGSASEKVSLPQQKAERKIIKQISSTLKTNTTITTSSGALKPL